MRTGGPVRPEIPACRHEIVAPGDGLPEGTRRGASASSLGRARRARERHVARLNISIVNTSCRRWRLTAWTHVHQLGRHGLPRHAGTLLPIAGRAGDLYGRRRVFLAGQLRHRLHACALAWNAGSLIAFRVVQAIGCAMAPTAYSPWASSSRPASWRRPSPHRRDRLRARGRAQRRRCPHGRVRVAQRVLVQPGGRGARDRRSPHRASAPGRRVRSALRHPRAALAATGLFGTLIAISKVRRGD